MIQALISVLDKALFLFYFSVKMCSGHINVLSVRNTKPNSAILLCYCFMDHTFCPQLIIFMYLNKMHLFKYTMKESGLNNPELCEQRKKYGEF